MPWAPARREPGIDRPRSPEHGKHRLAFAFFAETRKLFIKPDFPVHPIQEEFRVLPHDARVLANFHMAGARCAEPDRPESFLNAPAADPAQIFPANAKAAFKTRALPTARPVF